MTGPMKRYLPSPRAMEVYFANFNPVMRRGELILMNSGNYVHKSAVEAGKRAAFIVVAALALTLPLQSQQSAIGDSTEASGSVSQRASATSKQAQQVDQDPTAVKKRIEQSAEQSPMDPTTVALDGGAPAVPSSSPENPDPQQTAPAPSGQSPAPNSDHTLTGNFFHRLAQFYSQDWAATNPAGQSVTKRGLPAPVDSPPFPFSDWTYGGAPDIGAPDGNTYPLMSALNLANSRTKVYGWVAGSFNFRLFRNFSGLRSQVQTAAVEEDCSGEILLIAEAACGVLDPLDLGVDGFAGSVGDAVAEIGNDVLEASLQGPGYLQHGAQPTAYRPAVPPAKMFPRGPLVLVTEKCHGSFFQSPSPCRLQPTLP